MGNSIKSLDEVEVYDIKGVLNEILDGINYNTLGSSSTDVKV